MNAPTLPRFVMPVLAASLISLASHAQESPSKKENLFANADFAGGIKDWTIKVVAGNVAEVDNTEMREGKPSLKITNTKPGDTHVFQKITVKPNTRYRITAYIKSKDVIPAKPGSKNGASIAISGGYQTSEVIQKTKPWSKVEFDFESGGLTEMVIGPRVGQYNNPVAGTAWFTDIHFVELGKSRK